MGYGDMGWLQPPGVTQPRKAWGPGTGDRRMLALGTQGSWHWGQWGAFSVVHLHLENKSNSSTCMPEAKTTVLAPAQPEVSFWVSNKPPISRYTHAILFYFPLPVVGKEPNLKVD